MVDHPPKGQQRVTSRRPSGLRNEIRLDSADSDVVQVFDSEGLVPETQSQPDGRLSTIHHEKDKQSDYGGDDGFEDADLIARAVVDTKEILAPASSEWVPLTRDSYQQKYDVPAASSPHFTFGQPGKVGSRSSAQDDSARTQRASPPCQKAMTDKLTSHSKKGVCGHSPACSMLTQF